VEFIDESEDYEPFPGTKAETFPVPPLLKILGGTWYVSKTANLYHRGPLENFLWWTIIRAMETGKLAKTKDVQCMRKVFSPR
jgi:hypothetical protein